MLDLAYVVGRLHHNSLPVLSLPLQLMCLIRCAQQTSQLLLVCVLQDGQAKREAMSTAGCPPIIAHEVLIITKSHCLATMHED